MCINPILIPNTNYRPKKLLDVALHSGKLYNTDVTSHYIPVPCGHCAECVRSRQSKYVQKSLTESIDHYAFFGTLTYSNKALPSIDVGSKSFKYADVSDFQNMIKRMRKAGHFSDRTMKYLLVSEFGKLKKRPHFHFILFLQKLPSDTLATPLNLQSKYFKLFLSEWRRNLGSTRCPKWLPLCNYTVSARGLRNFDFHYVNPSSSKNGSADVVYYASKYALKYDPYVNYLFQSVKSAFSDAYGNPSDLPDFASLDLGSFDSPMLSNGSDIVGLTPSAPMSFSKYWSIIRPKFITSKHFGYHSSKQIAHIDKSISSSLLSGSDHAYFINPTTGKHIPLSGFYVKKAFTVDIQKQFLDRIKPSSRLTYYDYMTLDPELSDSRRHSVGHFNKTLKKIRHSNESFLEFPD